jgi:hypothetical protein
MPPDEDEKKFTPWKGWRRPISFIPLHRGLFLSWVIILLGVGGLTLWRDFLTDWRTALRTHLAASFCYVILASALAESVVLVERKSQRLLSEEGRSVAAVIAVLLLVFQAAVVDSKIESRAADQTLAAVLADTASRSMAGVNSPPAVLDLRMRARVAAVDAAAMTWDLFSLQIFVLVGAMLVALYLRTFSLEDLATMIEDPEYEDEEVNKLGTDSISKDSTSSGEEV